MINSFTLFGLTLYPYTLFMISGIAVCLGLYSFLTVRRHREDSEGNLFAIEMLIVSAAAALPSAILFDALFKIAEKGKFELEGATFYGGLLGALALFPILLSLKKGRKVKIYSRLCDLAPCIPAGHFFGRIGCFFGGCCYGVPTDGPFGVVFPEGSYAYKAYGNVAVHPTQLYEAAYLLVLFIFLITMGKKSAFPLYLMLYGVGRYAIECFRGDDRGGLGLPISPAQAVSLILFILGGVLLVWHAVNKSGIRKKPPVQSADKTVKSFYLE